MNSGIQNIVGAGQSYGMNDMMQQYYKLGKYAPKEAVTTTSTTPTTTVTEVVDGMYGTQPSYGEDFATEGQNFNPTVSANPFTPFSFNPFNPTRPTYRR